MDPRSEERPPQVEHWHGHMDVECPAQRPKLSRRYFLVLAVALLAGLATLGALWLGAAHWQDQHLLTGGVTVVIVTSIGFATLLTSPFPLSMDTLGARHLENPPLPLYAPTLMLFAFALPCLAVALVSIVQALP